MCFEVQGERERERNEGQKITNENRNKRIHRVGCAHHRLIQAVCLERWSTGGGMGRGREKGEMACVFKAKGSVERVIKIEEKRKRKKVKDEKGERKWKQNHSLSLPVPSLSLSLSLYHLEITMYLSLSIPPPRWTSRH